MAAVIRSKSQQSASRAALKFALEDRAEEADTETRVAVLGTQTLTPVAGTSAAGSGCPTDDIVAAAICIAAASAGAKTPSILEPRPRNTEDDMLEDQFEK